MDVIFLVYLITLDFYEVIKNVDHLFVTILVVYQDHLVDNPNLVLYLDEYIFFDVYNFFVIPFINFHFENYYHIKHEVLLVINNLERYFFVITYLNLLFLPRRIVFFFHSLIRPNKILVYLDT